MPRNPHKRRCHVPGCRSWAMREHTHCRAHRDRELGRRAAGAPRGNLNAIKTGRYAHPMSPAALQQIAGRIAREPDLLPRHLIHALQSIHDRSRSPATSLPLMARFIQQLAPYVIDNLFAVRLDAFLETLPPDRRPAIQIRIWKHALPLSPEDRIKLLNAIAEKTAAIGGSS